MPFFQDAEAKLTLTRVAPAPALVAEIAQATGQKLDVSPTLGAEILMVSVENARANDVLARIAVAATAVWQPFENGYRLVPDRAARSVEASAERARRLQAITDAMRKRQQAAAKAKPAPKSGAQAEPEDEDMGGMGAMFGMGGGAEAFLPLLDLNALAGMEEGDRIVFSTRPTATQRALRGNPMALVGDLIARHNKSAKGMAGAMDGMPEGMEAILKSPIGERMRRMSRPITAAPTKLLVVASRGGNGLMGMMGMGEGIRLEVRAYGANGAVLIEETGTVGTNMMERFAAMAAQAQQKPAATPAKATPIAYSEDAKAYLAMMGGNANPFMSGSFGKGTKLTKALRERLFAPDRFEPLGLLPGEGLAALAKARRKPLVACLPDEAYPGGLGASPPKTVEDVEESLKTGPMRLVPDASFLVVKPAEPETARRVRLDRGALAAFLRAVDDHEAPTLDEMAALAARAVPPGQNRLLMGAVSTFAPNVMVSMSGMVSWDALRLFGSLNPTQRKSLAEGAKIPFSNLGQGAQAALRALLYGAGTDLTVERPGASNEPDLFSMGMKMALGGGATEAREEPTEVAPSGLPAGGFLQAAVTSDAALRPVGDEGPIYYTLGTEELAMMRMVSSAGLPAEAQEAMRLPDAARLGTRTLWNLRGYVAPGVYVASALTDDRTPKDAPTVSLKALPADLQARVAQRTEKLKKSPLGQMMSMGAAFGGGKPPIQP